MATLPLAPGSRVLLAVSGGGDSVGMLALFLSARPRPDWALGVAHVDHGLRIPCGAEDAEWVRNLAGSLALPSLVLCMKGRPGKGRSREEWAREGRYRLLDEAREEGGWDFVATAHSRDDQAETVLLRLGRGSGLRGLAGIRPVAGRVIRPVLPFGGKELRGAAAECGLIWREDATNADTSIPRNRVRREVLPLLDDALPGLSRHLAALASEAAALDPPPLDCIAVVCDGSVYYGAEALRSLGREGAVAVFREGLRALKGDLRRVGRAHYAAMWGLLGSRPGAVTHLPEGWEVAREARGLRLRARPAEGEDP